MHIHMVRTNRALFRQSWRQVYASDIRNHFNPYFYKIQCELLQPLLALLTINIERCNPWPHVTNRHISISQLLSLWRHSHYDVIRVCRAIALTAPVLIMTLFSLWRHLLLSWPHPPLRTCVHTLCVDTLLRLIYRDVSEQLPVCSCVLAVTVVPFVVGGFGW